MDYQKNSNSYPVFVLRSTLHDFRLSSPSKVGRFWMLAAMAAAARAAEAAESAGPPVGGGGCCGMKEDGPRPPISRLFC